MKEERKIHYTLEIVPSVAPTLRHKIEDLLEKEGFSVIGGGQCARLSIGSDGSGTDISFEEQQWTRTHLTK